jgi:hypothetical protein
VIPDIENYDNLPSFSIIETSLKDMNKRTKLQKQKTIYNKEQTPSPPKNNHKAKKGTIELI